MKLWRDMNREERCAAIQSLRGQGWTHSSIAHALGATSKRTISDFVSRCMNVRHSPMHRDCSKAVKLDAARLMALIPDDTRSLTSRVCGDPLPGRSALDMRASH